MTSFLYSILVARLVEPAIRAAALASLAGLGLALFRVRDASLRLAVWTGVLVAALIMPFLGGLLPSLPLTIRVPERQWPAAIERQTPAIATNEAKAGSGVRPLRVGIAPRLETTRESRPMPVPVWPVVAVAAYLAGAALMLGRLAFGLAVSRKLRRGAEPTEDARAAPLLAELARSHRLKRLPALRTSSAVLVPVTLGPLRPLILLPTPWRDWPDTKLRAVLAHEVSHAATNDPLTQFISALHRSLFWFSPLSWWLGQKLAELAELRSDEVAVGRVADRTYYAGILLDFVKELEGASRRVRWEGASMAKGTQTNRRVEQILTPKAALPPQLKKAAVAAMTALAVPLLFLAATARPTFTSQAPPREAGPTPAPTPPAAPSRPPAPVIELAMSPQAVVRPERPSRGDKVFFEANGFVDAGEEGEHYVIVEGDSVTVSGSGDDVRRAKVLRGRINGNYIWFHRDEKEYVITDPATVQQAKALFAPQEELGRKQEALGKMQEELGAQQEALGKQMEEVRVKLPDLRKEIKQLEAELSDIDSPRTPEQLGEIQGELGELQGRIGEQMAQAGRMQGELGGKQGALGRQQGELGRKQGELGREQGRLAGVANRKMKQLLDDAVTRGLAKPATQ
jgi:bla regulator protein blaR1